MRVIVPGHLYELQNLRSEGTTKLQFYRDGEIHPESWDGPSCQEVIRALIDRVRVLDEEKPWLGNTKIVADLRSALAGFEARAIMRKAEKGEPIESYEVGNDGHLLIGEGE